MEKVWNFGGIMEKVYNLSKIMCCGPQLESNEKFNVVYLKNENERGINLYQICKILLKYAKLRKSMKLCPLSSGHSDVN